VKTARYKNDMKKARYKAEAEKRKPGKRGMSRSRLEYEAAEEQRREECARSTPRQPHTKTVHHRESSTVKETAVDRAIDSEKWMRNAKARRRAREGKKP
jgi:hypothetical protein